MAVKLFVLGLPGSGKSTVAREIAKYLDKVGWKSSRINDHAILEQMFHDDIECKHFKPADHGGFDIIDLKVFDAALKVLEKAAIKYILPTIPEEIILIEFARNDYRKAFGLFSHEFLQDAYFLYLDTKIDDCKKRIRDRISNQTCDDDYYVSEYIFSAYYNKNIGQSVPQVLERDYSIDKQRIMVIDNNRTLQEVSSEINSFIDFITDPASTLVTI